MRLLSRVERLAGLRRKEPAPQAVGIVWSADDERLPDDVELAEGERVAVDYYEVAGGTRAEGVVQRRLVERVTRERGDRGYVYDAGGAVVGRVVSVSKDGLVRVAMGVSGGRPSGRARAASKRPAGGG